MNTLAGSLRIDRLELDNGLVILVNERPDSELIVITGSSLAGAVFDGGGRSGLSQFTSGMMMRGTKKRRYMQIVDETESLGAGIRFHADDDLAWSSSRCTASSLDKTVELLFDCMMNPTFPEAEVEKVRGLMLTSIKEREDSTQAVAQRIAREMLFPKGSPYHCDPGGYEETVKAITREDVASFWDRQYGPESTILSFSGRITLEEVEKKVIHLSKDWDSRHSKPEVPAIEVPRPIKAGRRVLPMMHKSQADIVVMCQAVARSHPDNYALASANVILGKLGMMGRLGKTIRDKQGLAYYAACSYSPRITGGYWTAFAGVDPANVDRALESMKHEMTAISRDLVNRNEHRDAATHQIGSLALKLETAQAAAAFMHGIEIHGLGLDFVDRYEDIVNSVSREDVRRVCREYLRTEEACTAVVGPYQA